MRNTPCDLAYRNTHTYTERLTKKLSLSSVKLAAPLEVGSPGSALPTPAGQHVVGHTDDYSSLRQQLLEGKVLISKMEAMLQSSGQHKLQQVRTQSQERQIYVIVVIICVCVYLLMCY